MPWFLLETNYQIRLCVLSLLGSLLILSPAYSLYNYRHIWLYLNQDHYQTSNTYSAVQPNDTLIAYYADTASMLSDYGHYNDLPVPVILSTAMLTH